MRTHYDDQIERKQTEIDRLLREVEQLQRQRQMFADSQGQVAQVQFVGHAKRYCYDVDGDFEIGDYVRVFSPWTSRNELVRVVGRGRTPESMQFRNLKVAHVIDQSAVGL
jgi:hypothetical protein